MSISSLPLLAVVLAASVGSQDVGRPVASTAPAADPTIVAAAGESTAANQAALSAAADQTARIMRDRDLDARNLAAFAEAQAAYARDVTSYEAEKAAAARKAADEAATFRMQMAAWRAGVDRHRQPAPGAIVATEADAARPQPKRRCGYETPTGSNMPVRVCH